MFDAALSRRLDFWLCREERAGGWLRRFRRAMRRHYERMIP
jgi:hypothetical protein